LFACLHLLLGGPEGQHQHLATLAVAQGEVAAEAGDGANHRQHPLTHEPQVQLETAVVSDTGKAREPPEHTTPFGSPGPTPARTRLTLTGGSRTRVAGTTLSRWHRCSAWLSRRWCSRKQETTRSGEQHENESRLDRRADAPVADRALGAGDTRCACVVLFPADGEQ